MWMFARLRSIVETTKNLRKSKEKWVMENKKDEESDFIHNDEMELLQFTSTARGDRNRNQDSSRRTVNVEETSSKAMLAIDGAGFDWSYMADIEVPTNMVFMAFLDSEFWQTATASTLDNGEIEITATIDGKVKIVTEASIRRHLKLADSDGISNLPTTEIFEQLALMGAQFFKETEVPQPSSPPHTNVAHKVASTGVDVRYGGAATTVTGLEAGQGSDEEGSDSDILAQEDPSKQGRKIAQIDEDEGITLVQMGVSTASTDFTTVNVPVTTAGAEISTASLEVKTVGVSVDDIAAESLVYIRRSAAKTKDKGKGIMEESESAMTKTKRQQEQERLGLETTARLQEEFDKEERQRIARIHEVARSFYEVEWEDIRARLEASEELQLKRPSFDEIKDLFETTMRRANTFVPMVTKIRRGVPELVADSSQAAVTESTEARGTKRAAEEKLGQQSSKKQKSDELSQEELQQLMIIVPE
ncbi:hypothetical protein Tco_0550425 [Tanacetum coccineum]